ncbi:MAG: hypothetical protein RLY97_1397, partial [Pseudomonadota bacterium]
QACVYDFAQLVHSLGKDHVTILAHSLGGSIATYFTGLYPDKVSKFISIEGIGPSAAQISARDATPYPERMREWIDNKRKAAGRIPRRYPNIEAAYARMKEENSFLTDAQARHLTIHGISRNEDGSYSWKFDNYLNVWSVSDFEQEVVHDLWRAITCPMLMFYGTESFATNPERDGRMQYFNTARVIEYEKAGHWLHHDQFDRFMGDAKAFLAE